MNRIHIIVFLLGFFLIFSSCKQTGAETKKVEIPQGKFGQAMDLQYDIHMPDTKPDSGFPLLILMHGYGSNDKDMSSLAFSLDQRCMIVCVQAPHEIGFNKFSWYQFNRSGDGYAFSFDQLKESRDGVMKLIQNLQETHHINPDKIMVGGFSQGGMMSLALGLKHSDIIDGVIVLSGDLLDEVVEEIEGKELEQRIPIYMSHGRQDKVLPFAEAVKDVKLLKSKGFDVDEHYYDGAHNISAENLKSLQLWLRTKIEQ